MVNVKWILVGLVVILIGAVSFVFAQELDKGDLSATYNHFKSRISFSNVVVSDDAPVGCESIPKNFVLEGHAYRTQELAQEEFERINARCINPITTTTLAVQPDIRLDEEIVLKVNR